MKKLLLFAVMAIITISSDAQDKKVRLGLKLSPALAWNRSITPSSTLDIDNRGLKPKIGLGVIVDYYLGENYALGFGLNYATKGVGFDFNNNSLGSGKIDYSLQYLELPVTLKLFTNEISDDLILFFQVGGTLNINIQSKGKYNLTLPGSGTDTKLDTEYTGSQNKINPLEISGVFAMGVEKKMSESTIIVIGATYNRGLTSYIRTTKPPLSSYSLAGLKILNDYIALDFGLKF